MFMEDTLSSHITMNNVKIHIIEGQIYRDSHIDESYININNLSIQSKQSTMGYEIALFTFVAKDIVYISQLTILYTYNATLHCQYWHTFQIQLSTQIAINIHVQLR